MRALAVIAFASATLFILAGCGEEEKKREKQALLDQVRTMIDTEVRAQVRDQMREQLPAAVEAKLREMQEDYSRRVAEQQAAKTAAAGTAGAAGAAKTPATTRTAAPTTRKKTH